LTELGSYSGRVPLSIFDLGPAPTALLMMCWQASRAARSLSVVIDDDIRRAAGMRTREQVRRAVRRIVEAGYAVKDTVGGRYASLLLASWPDFHRSMQMPRPYFSGTVFAEHVLALTGPAMKLLLFLQTRAKRDGILTLKVDLKTARRAGIGCSWTFADAIVRLVRGGHMAVVTGGRGRTRIVRLAEWPGYQERSPRRQIIRLRSESGDGVRGRRSLDIARFKGGGDG
jgi:hypothetical protein